MPFLIKQINSAWPRIPRLAPIFPTTLYVLWAHGLRVGLFLTEIWIYHVMPTVLISSETYCFSLFFFIVLHLQKQGWYVFVHSTLWHASIIFFFTIIRKLSKWSICWVPYTTWFDVPEGSNTPKFLPKSLLENVAWKIGINKYWHTAIVSFSLNHLVQSFISYD